MKDLKCCIRLLLLLTLCAFVSACNLIRLDFNFVDNRQFEARILDQSDDVFAQLQPLALSPEIIAYMEENISDRSSSMRIVDQLQKLLFSPEYLNIQYDDAVTRTAIETFATRQGNCLSLVNLYIAMARHYGVDANFQTVMVRPSWDVRGELLVLSQHINALGRLNPSTSYIVDFTPEVSLQQLTASTISDVQARALYFNNLGAESLIAGKHEQAISYFKNALHLDPELSISWNNIGTAYSRSGDDEIAEYAYRKAFSIDRTNVTAISNLVKFYYRIGDVDTAQRYAKAIERFNNKNPYYHYNLGNIAFSEGDYESAEEYFFAAIKHKDSEPDFYLALSKTYEKLEQPERAAQLLEAARLVYLLADELYLPSRNKVRIVDEKSILRPGSSGYSVRASSL